MKTKDSHPLNSVLLCGFLFLILSWIACGWRRFELKPLFLGQGELEFSQIAERKMLRDFRKVDLFCKVYGMWKNLSGITPGKAEILNRTWAWKILLAK